MPHEFDEVEITGCAALIPLHTEGPPAGLVVINHDGTIAVHQFPGVELGFIRRALKQGAIEHWIPHRD